MRALVLLLMIALLPLRLWAADGMAVRMAQGDIAAAAGVAGQASMPDDCPMMAKAHAGPGSQDTAPEAADHCVVCHLCAASATLPGSGLRHCPSPTALQDAIPSRYASAEVSPDLRPPIA